MDPAIRCQPSTRTKSMSLKGKDIIIGGSIIIPILSRTLATTMSMIKKGTYNTNPIIKAVFSSLMTKAGMRMELVIEKLRDDDKGNELSTYKFRPMVEA